MKNQNWRSEMEQNSKTNLGAIRIHKKVVASIASIAALEVEGVLKISEDIGSNLLDMIISKQYSSIKVEIDKNNDLKRVQIPVVIKYGYNVSEVCSKVQEKVYHSIEKMTDSLVKQIDVNVQRIEKKEGK